jgi:hypothetical protein
MNISKLQEYYSWRLSQFTALSNAEFWFNLNNEIHMWESLFSYAEHMYQAKQLFDSFGDDDIEMLLGGRVPLFIMEVVDNDE